MKIRWKDQARLKEQKEDEQDQIITSITVDQCMEQKTTEVEWNKEVRQGRLIVADKEVQVGQSWGNEDAEEEEKDGEEGSRGRRKGIR